MSDVVSGRHYCPACDRMVKRAFLPGPGGRTEAKCPRCKALERQRFFALLLPILKPGLGRIDTILEIAPSPHTTEHLSRLGARRHLRVDIGYDSRLVDALGSVTALPVRDASVDLVVCYHVLEHVPDDATAVREIARVLAPGGVALLQVPWARDRPTEEDLEADEAERLRRFGQRDHVRRYGDDFETRLAAAGLTFDRVSPGSLLGEQMVDWCRLRANEPVWIARRGEGPAPTIVLPEATSLTRAVDAALAEGERVRGRLVAARAKIRRLRGQVAPGGRERADD